MNEKSKIFWLYSLAFDFDRAFFSSNQRKMVVFLQQRSVLPNTTILGYLKQSHLSSEKNFQLYKIILNILNKILKFHLLNNPMGRYSNE